MRDKGLRLGVRLKIKQYFTHSVYQLSFSALYFSHKSPLLPSPTPLTLPNMWRSTTIPKYSNERTNTVLGESLSPDESSEKNAS